MELLGREISMKYTIHGFGQAAAVNLKLDDRDLMILRWFVDYKDTGTMAKRIINEDMYYWIKYEGIKEAFPIVGWKKDTVYRRLKKMVEAKVLKHKTIKEKGIWSYYCLGEKYLQLLDTNQEIKLPTENNSCENQSDQSTTSNEDTLLKNDGDCNDENIVENDDKNGEEVGNKSEGFGNKSEGVGKKSEGNGKKSGTKYSSIINSSIIDPSIIEKKSIEKNSNDLTALSTTSLFDGENEILEPLFPEENFIEPLVIKILKKDKEFYGKDFRKGKSYQEFLKAIGLTLKKDDVDIITITQYDYFKKILKNIICA